MSHKMCEKPNVLMGQMVFNDEKTFGVKTLAMYLS